MHPHFLLDAGADHIVGFPQTAVVIDPDLGNDKKGNPPGTGRGPFDAGQHRVDDVIRQVLLGIGNENLAAGDGVGAVIVFDGGGGQRPHIRAGIGLCERHGAAPFSGIHLL